MTSTRSSSARRSASPPPQQAMQRADQVGDDVVFTLSDDQTLIVADVRMETLSDDMLV